MFFLPDSANWPGSQAGYATYNGDDSYMNGGDIGTDLSTMVHEIGHNVRRLKL